MHIVARKTLIAFWDKHPETKASLSQWERSAKAASWTAMSEIQAAFPKAKVLNAERVRFEIAGGNYRLIAYFKFKNQFAFVKFIGTHKEYDNIDSFTVSLF